MGVLLRVGEEEEKVAGKNLANGPEQMVKIANFKNE